MSRQNPSRARSSLAFAATGAMFVLSTPRLAVAQDQAEEAPPSFESRVPMATRAGQFLPLTLTPNVGPSRASAAGYGGYDTAQKAPRLESFAEVRPYGPFALRFGAQWRDTGQSGSPSISGRVQLLSQASHGIDGAISLAYKAEGFDEPEGELELVIAVARTFGNWSLLGNVAYGQDPEGAERDGEFRAAALCQLGTLFYLGLDGRGRFDMGSEGAKLLEHDEPKYDFDIGPVLNLALGPLAFGVHGGVSGIRRVEGTTRVGFVALAGLGTAL
jgi:hypothetical protein